MLMVSMVSAGPKGVIHDWRKFKLESEDHESMPQTRRELLRQMSNPKANSDDNLERINRKVFKQYNKTTKSFILNTTIIFNILLSPCLMKQSPIITRSQNRTIKLSNFSCMVHSIPQTTIIRIRPNLLLLDYTLICIIQYHFNWSSYTTS